MYRSGDARFRIEQEGPGRWFLVDEEQRDELGLARTSGPFSKLEDAREDAARLREMPATVSPLLPKIARAREKAATAAAAGEPPAPTSDRSRRPDAAAEIAAHARAGRAAAAAEPDAPASAPPPPPPPPSWLERLAPDDATRARRLISGLERLGFVDAERIVRTDTETGRPAVARALVARRVRRAALDAWQATDAFDGADDDLREALRRARDAGLGDDELGSIVAFVAHRAAVATLEQVTGLERDPDAPRPLPGWRFLEHDPARPDRERRIEVGADDLEHVETERRRG